LLYLVKDCPDFYFLPTFRFDQVFTWENGQSFWQCAKYWQEKGFQVHQLEEVSDEDCEFWYIQGNIAYTIESANAARERGRQVIPLRKLNENPK
jgi:hypothetical protein